MLWPGSPCLSLQFQLTLVMTFQSLKSKWGYNYTPATSLRLGFRLHKSLARHLAGNPCQNTPYLQCTRCKVNVLPFERQQFATSHTSCQSKNKKSLNAVTTSSNKQLMHLFLRKRFNLKFCY